jgi:hypothetical protein
MRDEEHAKSESYGSRFQGSRPFGYDAEGIPASAPSFCTDAIHLLTETEEYHPSPLSIVISVVLVECSFTW